MAEIDPEKLPKKSKESAKKRQLNPDAKVSLQLGFDFRVCDVKEPRMDETK